MLIKSFKQYPYYMSYLIFTTIQTQIFHYMIRSNKNMEHIKQKLRYFFPRVQLYVKTSSVGFREISRYMTVKKGF